MVAGILAMALAAASCSRSSTSTGVASVKVCDGVELRTGEDVASLIARAGAPLAIASSVTIRPSSAPNRRPDSIVVSCCREFVPPYDDGVMFVYFCNPWAKITLDRFLRDPLFASGNILATLELLEVGSAEVRGGKVVDVRVYKAYHIEFSPRTYDEKPCN